MEIIHFRTQLEIAYGLKAEIDDYWNMEKSELQFTTSIKKKVMANQELIYKNGNYTAIVKQKLGIRRLNLLTKVLGAPDKIGME